MNEVCKLCLKESQLQRSHIIPRSYFRNLKKENDKIVFYQDGKKKSVGNFDPKELMLCRECEQFLSINYEAYGIRLLRDHKNFRKNSNHVVISSFQYEKFYLYLISILWRASIAKHEYYKGVNGVELLDDILRHCIINKKIRINKFSQLRLDHFIKICIFRIVDSTKNVPDEVIKALLSNFVQTKSDTFKGVTWYFIYEGFIVFFNFCIGKDQHETRTLNFNSQLTKGSLQKIMKMEITHSKVLTELFNGMIVAAKQEE